jgi:hypothetical protein
MDPAVSRVPIFEQPPAERATMAAMAAEANRRVELVPNDIVEQ